jgi:outer membrane protein OmpA-like peptidoglycan-associated protein
MIDETIEDDVDHSWINIADIMSALMMVFMFIAVAFMYQLQHQKNLNRALVDTYRIELNKALHMAFDKNLVAWKATITEDNVFRFSAPFDTGDSEMSDEFKQIITEFFPRYTSLLTRNNFRDEIEEIRIEGHTSNGWGEGVSADDNYINNMYLSQKRASKVLDYSYRLPDYVVQKNKKWLVKYLRANGMSFSNLIYKSDNGIIEDKDRSRRVEFRVMVKNRRII